MSFSGQNLPLPRRPFPFNPSAQMLPNWVPDCHLVRTVNPCLPHYDSLGDFHDRMRHSLSLFCKHGFQKQYRPMSGHNTRPAGLLSPHVHSRQATLHAATRFCALLCRFLLDSYAQRLPPKEFPSSSHNVQVSTETGSYAPCHWSAPGILNPQHPP